MASRKITGTHHVRRRPRKGSIIAGIAALLVAIVAILGVFIYKGKLNLPKIGGEKTIVSETISVESEENLEPLFNGLADLKNIILVSTDHTEGGTISGAGGMIDKTGSAITPEESTNFITLAAQKDMHYLFNNWELIDNNGNKIATVSGNPLRIYYYDDASMVGAREVNGVASYITNQSVTAKAVFEEIPPIGAEPNVGSSAGRRDIMVLTAPNIGETHFWIYDDDTSTWGYPKVGKTGYLYNWYQDDARTLSIWIELSDNEKAQFVDKNNPVVDVILYKNGAEVYRHNTVDPRHAVTRDKLDEGGDYCYVLIPHLQSGGYQSEAIVRVQPNSKWGSATWTGSQVVATPSQGYEFDHWEWYSQNQLNTSKEKTMAARPQTTTLYTAYFKEAKYNVSMSGMTPANAATITGLDAYAKGKDATIKVTPKPGYKFKDATWTTTDGIYHHATGSPDYKYDAKTGVVTFGISNIQEDIYLNFEFDYSKFTIETKSNPSTRGTTSVENVTAPSAPGPLTKEDFALGDKAVLTATPSDGNVFLYWEDSNGNRYEDATLTIDKVYVSESFTAHFAPGKVKLTVNTGDGEVTVYYTGTDGQNKSETITKAIKDVEIAPNTSVTLGAKTTYTDASGNVWKFANYTKDTDSNRYTDNPFTIPNIINDTVVTANYVPDEFEIKTVISPSGVGSASIIIDGVDKGSTVNVQHGQEITLQATVTNTNYQFLYFVDKNGNRITNTTFNVYNGAETFTAVFGQKTAKVTVRKSPDGNTLIKYTDKNGDYQEATVTTADADFEVLGGSSFTLTGIPSGSKHILEFVDKFDSSNPKSYPVPAGSNSVTITNTLSDMKFEAMYEVIKYKVSYNVSPYDGGTVTVEEYNATKSAYEPVSGNPAMVSGGKIKITAAETSSDYKFLYFKDSNGNIKKDNPYYIDPIKGDVSLTAIFTKGTGTLTISTNPLEGGTVEIQYTDKTGNKRTVESLQIDDIQNGTDVTLIAIPKYGYEFKEFRNITASPIASLGTDSRVTISKFDGSIDAVEALFAPQTFTIETKIDPKAASGCSAILKTAKASGQTVDAEYGEEVTITATPGNGWRFKYFEDESGNRYEGTDVGGGKVERKFTASSAMTLKACFGYDEIRLNVRVTPNDDAGGYIVSYTDVEGNKVVTDELHGSMPFVGIKGYSDLEIRAISKTGYKFAEFTDTDKGVFTTNPLIYNDLAEHKDVTIHFVPDENEIKVVSSPEMGGTATVNGSASSQKVQPGQPVEIVATPSAGYTFKMFKDSQGNEFTSNPLKFNAVNGSETYTAYFVKNEVGVTIDLTPSGAGTVRFNEEPAVSRRTTYSAAGRSVVRLTAMAKENNEFLCWRDQDGNAYPDNPLTIVDISKDLTFTAVFDNDSIGIKAVASPASGGKIRKIVNDDGSITIVATPNKGHNFLHWKKGGTVLTSDSKYTIAARAVHDGDLYTAVFEIDPNYDAKSDITKEKFYREWRKVITPNYTVTRDSMKLLAMQTVAGLRQYDDATPGLRNYSAVSNAQAYFDERVAKDIARLDAKFGDSELMTVEGEVLTPDLLPDWVEYEAKAKEFTDKKFGDRYETEILTVKRVLQPEDFDNKKRTYLWRYTGAEFKDNIYLLYNIDGKKHDWVSPIVDEDGVLKFTIKEFKDRDIVAVVRVKIK